MSTNSGVGRVRICHKGLGDEDPRPGGGGRLQYKNARMCVLGV